MSDELKPICPMPTEADRQRVILSTLADAEKGMKVLSTILRKLDLQGYAIADEVIGNIKSAITVLSNGPTQADAPPAAVRVIDDGMVWRALYVWQSKTGSFGGVHERMRKTIEAALKEKI